MKLNNGNGWASVWISGGVFIYICVRVCVCETESEIKNSEF